MLRIQQWRNAIYMLAILAGWGGVILGQAWPNERQLLDARADTNALQQVVDQVLSTKEQAVPAWELDGAAEAAYLLYGIHPGSDSLQALQATLRKLWSARNPGSNETPRMDSLAVRFEVASLEEERRLALAHQKDNSYYAFCYCSELVRVGNTQEAQRVMLGVDVNSAFSDDEWKGLVGLYRLVGTEVRGTGDKKAAALVWRVYDLCPAIDVSFLGDVLSTARFSYLHMGAPEDVRDGIVLRRVIAVDSMLKQGFLASVAAESVGHLADLRAEIVALKGTGTEEGYRSMDGALGNASKDADKVRENYVKWQEFRSRGISDDDAKALLEEGQISFMLKQK